MARERALQDENAVPETAGDFERLLIASPNDSLLWVKFMAFKLGLADTDVRPSCKPLFDCTSPHPPQTLNVDHLGVDASSTDGAHLFDRALVSIWKLSRKLDCLGRGCWAIRKSGLRFLCGCSGVLCIAKEVPLTLTGWMFERVVCCASFVIDWLSSRQHMSVVAFIYTAARLQFLDTEGVTRDIPRSLLLSIPHAVLRLERDGWSIIKRLWQATNENVLSVYVHVLAPA